MRHWSGLPPFFLFTFRLQYSIGMRVLPYDSTVSFVVSPGLCEFFLFSSDNAVPSAKMKALLSCFILSSREEGLRYLSGNIQSEWSTGLLKAY